MWIQHKTFLLKFFAKYDVEIQRPDINVYDSNLEPLPIFRDQKNGIDQIEISVTMPNTVLIDIRVDVGQYFELNRMIFSGVPVNKEKMLQITQVREHATIETYRDFPPRNGLRLEKSGIFLIDLFDNNPFLFLLKIGNKIPI